MRVIEHGLHRGGSSRRAFDCEMFLVTALGAAFEGVAAEFLVEGVGEGVEAFLFLVVFDFLLLVGVGEEGGLDGFVGDFGFGMEVGGGRADEADRLEVGLGPVLPDFLGEGFEGEGGVGGGGEGFGSGEGLEVAEADFEGEGFGGEMLGAEFAGDGCDLFGEDWGDGARVGEVGFEGLFLADGFGFGVGGDGAVVDAVGELEVVGGFVADVLLEEVGWEVAEVGDSVDAEEFEFGGHGGTDAPEFGDGEGREEGVDLIGCDEDEAVGFLEIGGELGEEFVRGDADGGGEAGVGFDL